ncbi:hypothetical protein D3C75_995260 [compost metagenome]
MFFLGFVIHDVLLLAAGFLVGRVQDVFFQAGMDRDFHFQLFKEIGALFQAALGGFAQLAEDAFYAFMVGFQQVYGIHGQVSQVEVSANGFYRRSLIVKEH